MKLTKDLFLLAFANYFRMQYLKLKRILFASSKRTIYLLDRREGLRFFVNIFGNREENCEDVHII